MMAKAAPLALSLLALVAHIHPVEPFYIPPFLNHTNSTDSTHVPKPPKAPFSPVSLSSKVGAGNTGTGSDKPSGPYFWQGSRKWEDRLCGPSSYISNTSPTSALAADCLLLADDAETYRYSWYANGFADNNTLLGIRSRGSCNFGIRPETLEDVGSVLTGWYIGGKDIANIVRHVVEEFDANGQAGASGLTHCTVNKHNHIDVHWAVYGPGEQEQIGWYWAPPVPSAAGKNTAGLSFALAIALAWLAIFW